MKKLTLNLESLEVQSFTAAETRAAAPGAGVFLTSPDNCVTVTCGDSSIRPCF